MDKGKGLVIVAGGLAGLIAYLATRKPKPPPTAIIKIEILPLSGGSVSHSSPAVLIEGKSYVVRLTITNASTKAEVPWEAVLTVAIGARVDGITLIPAQSISKHFAAGGTRSFDYTMNVPLGAGFLSGAIDVEVSDPTGAVLASASEPLSVAEIPIIYGADVVLGA